MKGKGAVNPGQLKAVCSVSELARLLNLSRQRFYQLLKQGVFPYPLYCIYTRRPFYSKQMQFQCLQIRQSGIGLNKRPILFYSPRQNTSQKKKEMPRDKRINDISLILKQIGLNLSDEKLTFAIHELYPKGLPEPFDEGLIVRDLFRYFK